MLDQKTEQEIEALREDVKQIKKTIEALSKKLEGEIKDRCKFEKECTKKINYDIQKLKNHLSIH
mgnify:CR=1 FL=1